MLLYSLREAWTPEEIKLELDRRASIVPFLGQGPSRKTIVRWLKAFRLNSEKHTSFYIQQLTESRLETPKILSPAEQALKADYRSWYFLECLSALFVQLYPAAKCKLQFIWHANRLIFNLGHVSLFSIRPP